MERGTGTLYSGSCSKSNTIGKWLHLVINALSTLLLSGSHYTQQCLAAPTRSEVDAAHPRRRWTDIGVPSVRNLFMIKAERRLLWIAIGITSVPLHLLYVYITVSTRVLANWEHFRYNSAVYTSLMANNIFVTAVTTLSPDHTRMRPGCSIRICGRRSTLPPGRNTGTSGTGQIRTISNCSLVC